MNALQTMSTQEIDDEMGRLLVSDSHEGNSSQVRVAQQCEQSTKLADRLRKKRCGLKNAKFQWDEIKVFDSDTDAAATAASAAASAAAATSAAASDATTAQAVVKTKAAAEAAAAAPAAAASVSESKTLILSH